ncbi:MAG TPA: cyanophycin synthetase [Azospirillaceae bacterium]|nr:cyanophycin synthetase [Azospirillaceae bacterium]
MEIVKTSVYVGPNIYARVPVIRFALDLGQHAETRVDAATAQHLLGALPGLGRDDTFAARLQGGTVGLAEALGHIAVELQRAAGSTVELATIVERGGSRVDAFYAFEIEATGLSAGDFAFDYLLVRLGHPDAPRDFDFHEELEVFLDRAARRTLGPSTYSLIKAAEDRDIPWFRLNDKSLIQLGHGKYQHRIEATTTSRTSVIATEIASDKNLTNKILSDLGLPVPEQRIVYKLSEALKAAERIGYPVVVKPVDGNHGRGVSVNLNTPEEVEAAYDKAADISDGIIVESLILGLDHRLLVVDGQLVAAARRMPGHVVGDGKSTVAELVAIVNQDPRRGVGHENVLTRLELDDQALKLLAEAGMDVNSVPPAGETVFLRKTANLSTGGTAIDVTDTIHPDNREMAERAIKAVGLDVGGVDFLTSDITKSYRETGGAICEINAGPGFRMHVAPSEGTPRDVAGKVMDMLFPPGSRSRVPTAAITGTNGKTTTSRMLAHIMKQAGHHVGLTTTDAVYINGNLTVKGDMTGPTAAGMVLKDPGIDMAVLETARGGILRAGLGYDRCDVAAVLNVASDHLGLGGIDTLEELARVKRVLVEVARDTAVLNADNEYTLRMAEHTTAKQVMWVTMDPAHALVGAHIREGGRACVLESGANGDMVTLYDKGAQLPLMWTHLIPATIEGKARHNVQNAMFAAAMAYALGKSLDEIRHGLRTFDSTFYQTPGRMNVFTEHPFKVILDYGHNPHAMAAMVDLVDRLAPKGKRIVVMTAPGDRRDEDIREVAHTLAGKFDLYICKRDDSLRGRGPTEVPDILRTALLEKGVGDEQIRIIPEEEKAVDTALSSARPDDLVLVFGADITRCWKQIIYFRREPGTDAIQTERRDDPVADYNPPAGYKVVRDGRGVILVGAG